MKVQFVLDYRSIYAYLADTQMSTLGATIDYQLVDIVSIMKTVKNQPSPMCPPKARYSFMDAMRWARIYDVPMCANESLLAGLKEGKLENALLSRAGIAAQKMGVFERVNKALFSAVWAGQDHMLTAAGRHQFALDHDLPTELWQVAESPEVAATLAANNEQAIENGVFGAPTFFVEKEMFFGNDRLSFVKEMLNQSKLGATP